MDATGSSRLHAHRAQVPRLSHYTASQLHIDSHYRKVQEPQWDYYGFHMIRDHPINAAEHQKSIDKEFKNHLIDEEQHELESNNIHQRQLAVDHVLNGGMVADDMFKVVIHRKEINAASLQDHRKNNNVAEFITGPASNRDRPGRQTFVPTWKHIVHQHEENKKHGARVEEIAILQQHPGTGKHVEMDAYEPSHTLQSSKGCYFSPPSSPPHSPKSPAHGNKSNASVRQ